MSSLQTRVERLERRANRRLWLTAICSVAIGAWLGAAADPTTKTLIASSLVIVDADGRPVIDLAASPEGGGRLHVRDASGVAGAVLSSDDRGGAINLFDAQGSRLARLGASPTGDGMLLLSSGDGHPLVRAGRWMSEEGGSVWTAPISESSTP
jgi:hypothetical protein